MAQLTVFIDREDAETISENDFAHASRVADRLYTEDTPIASALGRLIETLIEEIEDAMVDEIPDISPDTKATLEVAKMIAERKS